MTIAINQGYDSGYLGFGPEKLGFELIDEIQWGEACYDFDLTCLWRHVESGTFWLGSDSGCSCPTPFEDVSSTDDLTEVTKLQVLIDYLEERVAEQKTRSYQPSDQSGDAADMIRRYREAKAA